MAINVRELLSTPVDQIERPKSLPAGHLLADIFQYEFGTTRGNGTPYVRIHFNNLAAGPDLDDEALSSYDLSSITLRTDMWITPKALDRLDRMLDSILGPNTNKRTCDERLPDIKGARVMVGVKPRMNEDGTDSGYNDITTVTSPPEE